MGFAELIAAADQAGRELLGGVSVTYTPAVGSPVVTVSGMFDEQFVLAQGTAQAGVETVGPAVSLTLAELPTDPRVDKPKITIAGVDYHVIGRHPGGLGLVVLELRRVT